MNLRHSQKSNFSFSPESFYKSIQTKLKPVTGPFFIMKPFILTIRALEPTSVKLGEELAQNLTVDGGLA